MNFVNLLVNLPTYPGPSNTQVGRQADRQTGYSNTDEASFIHSYFLETYPAYQEIDALTVR